jgi:hypothetical protein
MGISAIIVIAYFCYSIAKILMLSSKQSTTHTTISVYNNIPAYHFNSINNRYNSDPILNEEYLISCNLEINMNSLDEEKKKLFGLNLTRKAKNLFKYILRRRN